MKYQKYRNAAKRIVAIMLPICFLAAVIYTLLSFTTVIPAGFEWEYLALIGIIAGQAIFFAAWLGIISIGLKKCEENEQEEAPVLPMAVWQHYDVQEKKDDAVAEAAVETNDVHVHPPVAPVRTRNVNININLHHRSKPAPVQKEEAEEAVEAKDKKALAKKVAMVAIPTAVAATAIGVAAAARAKKKRKMKKLIAELMMLAK